MAKTFNYNDSKNMVISVCSGYLERSEIKAYFEGNYSEDKIFEAEELKQIVHKLVEGKVKHTKSIDETFTFFGSKRKNYEEYDKYDEYEER